MNFDTCLAVEFGYGRCYAKPVDGFYLCQDHICDNLTCENYSSGKYCRVCSHKPRQNGRLKLSPKELVNIAKIRNCQFCNRQGKSLLSKRCFHQKCSVPDCKYSVKSEPYCKNHTCNVTNCKNLVLTPNTQCEHHVCSKCPKFAYEDYCSEHGCQARQKGFQCSKEVVDGGIYCSSHNCHATGCYSSSRSIAGFCFQHYCRICGSGPTCERHVCKVCDKPANYVYIPERGKVFYNPDVDEYLCYDHGCQNLNCVNTSSVGLNPYCKNLERRTKDKHYPYCESCKCVLSDCNRSRGKYGKSNHYWTVENLCESHACEKIHRRCYICHQCLVTSCRTHLLGDRKQSVGEETYNGGYYDGYETQDYPPVHCQRESCKNEFKQTVTGILTECLGDPSLHSKIVEYI